MWRTSLAKDSQLLPTYIHSKVMLSRLASGVEITPTCSVTTTFLNSIITVAQVSTFSICTVSMGRKRLYPSLDVPNLL